MNNIELCNGFVKVKVNTSIYPVEAVYSAAFVFLDKAYILLEGEPKKEVIVSIKPKNSENAELFGLEFNNELVNYANYKFLSDAGREIKNTLLARALLTNSSAEEVFEKDEEVKIPWEDDKKN